MSRLLLIIDVLAAAVTNNWRVASDYLRIASVFSCSNELVMDEIRDDIWYCMPWMKIGVVHELLGVKCRLVKLLSF